MEGMENICDLTVYRFWIMEKEAERKRYNSRQKYLERRKLSKAINTYHGLKINKKQLAK